ncbi:lasso RiPP family leader peptide-containing protein [Kineococcus sp. SYSU DK005]
MAEQYVAPRLTTLGSLAELTLRNKDFGLKSDGDFLCADGQDLYTVS